MILFQYILTVGFARETDKAIEQLEKTLELSPTASLPLELLALFYGEKGMYDEAITILQQFKDIPTVQTILADIYCKAGKKKEVHKILDEFLEKSERGYFSPLRIASVYAGLGETDKSFEWLDKSVEEHDSIYFIKTSRIFDDLRSDPRWITLMGKMNLAN